jgi:class 3 adenylate cyclase
MQLQLRQAVLQAMRCSEHTHARLSSSNNELSLHMGLGCGKCHAMHVGGVLQRWEYIVAGEALQQIALAEPMAEPGETVLSPEAFLLVQDMAEGQLRQMDDGGEKRFLKLSGFKPQAELAPPYNVTLDGDGFDFQMKHVQLLQRYIPAAVHTNLMEGQGAQIAEIRMVTVVFIKLHGIDINEVKQVLAAAAESKAEMDAKKGGSRRKKRKKRRSLSQNMELPPDLYGAVQQVMEVAQLAIYENEGSVNKLLVDDKGLLLLAVFGLPPFFHTDDPPRAVATARLLVNTLQRMVREKGQPLNEMRATEGPTEGRSAAESAADESAAAVAAEEEAASAESGVVGASIGICTGNVFCGVVGETEAFLPDISSPFSADSTTPVVYEDDDEARESMDTQKDEDSVDSLAATSASGGAEWGSGRDSHTETPRRDSLISTYSEQGRREYTVLGDTVNVAARLMGRAKKDQILVDEATKEACEQFYCFAPPDMVALKGKATLVPVYEPAEKKESTEEGKKANVVLDMGFGRWEERGRLKQMVLTLLVRGGGTLIMTGHRGSGKTALVKVLEQAGRAHGAQVLSGKSGRVDRRDTKTKKRSDMVREL